MTHQNSIRTSRGLHKLQLLRNYQGPPEQFWTVFIDSISNLVGADTGIVVNKNSVEKPYKIKATYSADRKNDAQESMRPFLDDTLEKCSDKNVTAFSTASFSLLAVPLPDETGTPKEYALLKVSTVDSQELSVATFALSSTADIPLHFHRQNRALKVLEHQDKILNVLDLNVQLNAQNRFLSAAMILCNELAAAYGCTRVSLGWRKGNYIRLMAMNQTDHFEKRMEIVQKAEMAMEEAAEQDVEICFPVKDDDGSLYIRDHENYHKAVKVGILFSLPVRYDNNVIGACLIEKNGEQFTEQEMHYIRMVIDQVAVRLNELFLRDRWIGARLVAWGRTKLTGLFGFEHTWLKLILGIVFLLLVGIVTIPVSYRVDSPMILKTDAVTFLAAPFDGYISGAWVRAGESVDSGMAILELDKKELVLEEAELVAELTKVKREEDKYRADENLAEMHIAQSQGEQLDARLKIVRLRLSLADVKAPFSGIVIEGEQHERIGSPVKQGEILYKLGRIEDIRVEAKVSENEIQNVCLGAKGQVALTSRPNELFAITVQRIEPAAVSEDVGNIFQVVCTFERDVPQWFRPGMTGISKIETGKKTVFWIVSHRTIDFLRLKFWW
jgi:multidrug resistance efflux pump